MLKTICTRLVPALALLLLAGCFETKLSLGPGESAKVDPKLLGDWRVTWNDNGETQSADLLVTNFNGREYYVEWKPQGDESARVNAYTIDVKGATFAQLKGIKTDAELEEKHLIIRAELKDGKLLIRHLNEEFFNDVTTDEELQRRVGENLDNAKMYGLVMTGTKKTTD